jgi:membrane-associated phospholipid phosphatase
LPYTNAKKLSMLTLNALALWTLDQNIFRLIHVDLHRDFLDPIMLIITYTGDGHIQIPILLFLAINKKTRAYGLAMIAAFCTAGILRIIVKQIVDRPRPSNLDFANPLTWPGGFPGGPEGWLGKTFDVIPYGNSSFPSGHSTTSFAMAFMLAWMVYRTENAWIGWLAALWATLVGLSRIYVGVHYPGDVIAAAALSGIVTSALYLFWKSKNWLPRHVE